MASTTQRTINGNFVYVDTAIHANRIIEAIGPDVVKYLTDFVDEPVTLDHGEYDALWTITRVGSSTFGPQSGAGGLGRITTGASINNGVNAQQLSAAFRLALANTLYFGISFKVSDATNCGFFVGLAVTDTDVLSSASDYVGFKKATGSTAVSAVATKDTTPTNTTGILTMDTGSHFLEFFWTGSNSNLIYYVDGAIVGQLTANANVPDDVYMQVSLQGITGATASKTFDVDFIKVVQIGRS